MSKETIVRCDVCESKIDHRDHYNINPRNMQLLRHFDDCDGRTFQNHLVLREIHICGDCYEKVLNSGMYLVDKSVQGHGDIELKEKGK